MSNFSSIYLDVEHDGEITNVDTVNSVPCAGGLCQTLYMPNHI